MLQRSAPAALRFIATNAHRPIQVPDVVAALGVARRSLEKSFRRLLGRSILQEIHRVRAEKARHLLGTTDLSASDITVRTGFSELKRLSMGFRRKFGTTPIRYRQGLGGGGSDFRR